MDDLGTLANMDSPDPKDGPGEQRSSVLPPRSEGEAVTPREIHGAEQRLDAARAALEAAAEAVREAEKGSSREGLSTWQHAAAARSLAQAQREHERAAVDVARLEEEHATAASRLAGERTEGQPAKARQPRTTKDPVPEPELFYGSAEEFLHKQLLPLYNRIVDGKNGKWCRKWYLHPEAVSRVEALWRAWEHLRLDAATGLSVWWRDHADPHLGVLLSPKGPFHACTTTTHYTPDPVLCEYAPDGWFPDERDSKSG